jgi:ornithine cyclodeaminase
VGACFAATRELDGEAVARARFYTDRRESCLAESGDFLLARAEGAITDAHLLGELGEVFLGSVRGRAAPADITLFKSLGLAVEDLASAHHLLARARATKTGTWLEWGGPASA